MSARLLTLREVCERLRLSDRKVRLLVVARRISVLRIGRCLRFRESAVDEYLAAIETLAERPRPLRSLATAVSAPPDSDHLDELVRKHGLD